MRGKWHTRLDRKGVVIGDFDRGWAGCLLTVAARRAPRGDKLKPLGGEVTKLDNWGKRRLAYDIRKQREGTYAVFEVSAEPSTVKEFERQLRLNANVLRFPSPRVPIRKKR